MTPLILVANAGSSSLKFALFNKNEADQPVAQAAGQVEGIGTQPRFTVMNAAGQTLVDRAQDPDDVLHHGGAISVVRSWLTEHDQGAKLLAVGHRVVHGGQDFSEPVLVDEKVLTELEALVPLAPVHQPQCILEEDTCGSLGLGGELLAAPWAPQTTPLQYSPAG